MPVVDQSSSVTAVQQAVPVAGEWVTVPVRPTVKMLAAWWRQRNCGTQEIGAPENNLAKSDFDCYAAMLAAAPSRLTEPARKADRLGEGVAWSFNPETRDIECGNAPVFKVYSPDDFPCIDDEDRAKQAEYFDAQAQTVVLMLNSLLHDSGDATPVPDPTHTREAELLEQITALEKRGAEVVIAYHVAICSPKGVVPDDTFYDARMAADVQAAIEAGIPVRAALFAGSAR
jgi:hypothetical protein